MVLGAAEPDSGVYTCTARNLAGEVSCKAELVVRSGTATWLPPCMAPRGSPQPPDRRPPAPLLPPAQPAADASMEEDALHKARRLTDYYDVHEEIGRYGATRSPKGGPGPPGAAPCRPQCLQGRGCLQLPCQPLPIPPHIAGGLSPTCGG